VKIRVGLIGLGFISQISHLKCIKKNPHVSIESICDKNKILLNQISKKYKIKKKFTSYAKMIKDNRLDGIVLCVDRANTEKISKFILQNKINLLTEKPSALSSKSAKKLSNLAIKNRCIYLTGYMKRHDRSIQEFKDKLNKKNLGNLKSIHYEHFSGDSYGKQTNYFKSRSVSEIKNNTLNKKFTGRKNNFLKFLNTHCHTINLLRFLIGNYYLKKSFLNSSGEGKILFIKNKIQIVLENKYLKSKKWHENLVFIYENGKAKLKVIKPFTKKSSTFKIIKFKQKKIVRNLYKNSWAFQNQIDYFVKLLKMKKNKKKCEIFSVDSSKDISIIEKIFNY